MGFLKKLFKKYEPKYDYDTSYDTGFFITNNIPSIYEDDNEFKEYALNHRFLKDSVIEEEDLSKEMHQEYLDSVLFSTREQEIDEERLNDYYNSNDYEKDDSSYNSEYEECRDITQESVWKI